MLRFLFAGLLLCAGVSGTTAAAREKFRPSFQVKPCTGDNLAAGLRCGGVLVPEDWSHSNGRRIALNFVVLPAKSVRGEAPLFFLAGGPGSPATEYAPFYLNQAAPYRETRDVVLFDMRGTGGSGALHCPAMEPPVPDIAKAYGNPYPPTAVRACRDALSRGANLRLYNTPAAVRDLDAVRQALGYETIDLRGLSYGTTYALAYLHAYPARVRAAVLESVAAPADLSPAMFGPAAQRGLDALLQACEAQADCHGRYGAVREDLRKVLADLARDGGFTAQAGDPSRAVRFTVTGEQFLEELRGPLSVSPLARGVPKLIHAAAGGDYQPFVDATLGGKLHANSFSRGLFLSVICTDSFTHLRYAATAAMERRTLFGDYKLGIQRAACDLWPKAQLPASFYAGFASPVPTLFLSGALDPVTPPDWAARIARRFRHGRQIILPGMGHIPVSDEEACVTTLEMQFLERPWAKALDASCAAALKVGAFD